MTTEQREMERAKETQQKIMDERRLRMAYVRGDLLLNWLVTVLPSPRLVLLPLLRVYQKTHYYWA